MERRRRPTAADTATSAGLYRWLLGWKQALTATTAHGLLRHLLVPFRPSPDGLPLPGPVLMASTAGTADVDWFLESGREAFQSLADCLRNNGLEVGDLDTVLDFGCGCGRVIRHWPSNPDRELWGADCDARAVRWCQKHLAAAKFSINGLRPPLVFPDGLFDLVYGLSVFTHLPAPLQQDWMNELGRILRRGGCLLLSLHGEAYRSELTPAEEKTLTARGIVVRQAAGAGTNRCGAYVTEAYARRVLAAAFEVIDYLPEGARGNPRQDLMLLRKPDS